jgi:uracil-DNA glycosylase
METIQHPLQALVDLEQAFGVEKLPMHMTPAQRKPHAAVVTTGSAQERLEALAAEAQACTACPLHRTRTNVVFGVGSAIAKLVFVGEAPGRDEDLQGEPFVGRAGQLLTKIIEAMGMQRAEVYICNVLKDRPPKNRPPEPAEVAACEHFLQEQISIIQPRVLCTLGKHATVALLGPDITISKVRGTWHEWHGVPLMPTYHPAYLLRNPSAKKDVWQDMKAVRDRIAALS